jgi:RNA polymerase sigma-70 factor (ECF subfamily)
MTSGQVPSVLRYLRQLVGQRSGDPVSDRHLLERFATRRDETAFATLLERHGPMVYGVCLRLLQDAHDAEDAFQATFLVLARKAASVPWQESVGGWLHEVAYRVACKARTAAGQAAEFTQRLGQREVVAMPSADPLTQVVERELRAVLDEELAYLPEKYRLPVVLCYLESRTNEEAARQLGWTKGTVSGRLSRARELLRRRLTRRGMTLSAATLAAALTAKASAAVPAALVDTTLKAAVLYVTSPAALTGVSAKVIALTEGVITPMFLTRMKIAAAVFLVVALLGASAAFITYRTLAADQEEKKDPGTKPADKPVAKPRTDLEKMQGVWHITAAEWRGKKATKDELLEMAFQKVVIEGNEFTEIDGDVGPAWLIKIDPAKKPKTIDWIRPQRIVKNGVETRNDVRIGVGIYEIEGDTLKIARSEAKGDLPGAIQKERALERPTDFKTKPGSKFSVVVYKRGKPPVKPDKQQQPKFVKAEVTLHRVPDDTQDPPKELKKTIKDKATLARIVSCFPEMGRGKKTNVFGGWLTSVTIKFEGSKGETVTVKVSHNWTNWSEGGGDWKVKANLLKYVGELFEIPRMKDQGNLLDPWRVVTFEEGGKKRDVEKVKLVVTDYDFILYHGGKALFRVRDYSMNPGKKPREIDLYLSFGKNQKLYLGIYAIEGNTLKICLDKTGKNRPTEFKTRPGNTDEILLVLERATVGKAK